MIEWSSKDVCSSRHFGLKAKLSQKLSLGEYGRQRTSSKFHDLVLSLRSQNSRVLEMRSFQALFSRRKFFIFLIYFKKLGHISTSFVEHFTYFSKKQFVYILKRGWDKSPSLSMVFGLSSKTQWLSGLYFADFISFYRPTQLCRGGTTKSNSNE